jgi:hypothetical protein
MRLGSVWQGFLWPDVILMLLRILDPPGKQIDPFDPRMRSERAQQLDHIENLTARVSIAAQLQILTTNQTVKTDEYQMELG